jgi:Bacterial transcriptional regulator
MAANARPIRSFCRKVGRSVEELEVGLNAVAAPLYSADGTVVATIGVSGPTFRLPITSIPEVGALARSAAAEISRRLGFEQAGGGRRKAGVEDRPPSSASRLPPPACGEVTERS